MVTLTNFRWIAIHDKESYLGKLKTNNTVNQNLELHLEIFRAKPIFLKHNKLPNFSGKKRNCSKLITTSFETFFLQKKLFVSAMNSRKIETRMSDDDVTVRPWLLVNIFLVVSVISFSYKDKLYIKMPRIFFSPHNYHHQQQFLSKLKESNENDMLFHYFSCFGWHCFWPTSMAPLSLSALARCMYELVNLLKWDYWL